MRVVERLGGVLELGMRGHLLHGNRDIREFFSKRGTVSEGKYRTTGMNESRKSDNNIVPKKPANNGGKTSTEQVEGRTLTKRNIISIAAVRTLIRDKLHVSVLWYA